MTSSKQAAANRRNSRRSTGPKTPAGKAIARLNAVKHGGLSSLPVIPNMESQEEWEAHLAGTLASLEPEGHLETVLAERVALTLWRLNRVARSEREVVALSQEAAEDDVAELRRHSLHYIAATDGSPHPRDVRQVHHLAAERLRALTSLQALPDETPMSGEKADLILTALAEQTRDVDFESEGFPLPGRPDDASIPDFPDWTVGLLRQALRALAAHEEVDAADLLQWALQAAQREAAKRKDAADEVARDLDRTRRQRLLPERGTLEMLSRYEAHLSRQLNQALHELQRLQAARVGAPVSLPAALDVSLSGPA